MYPKTFAKRSAEAARRQFQWSELLGIVTNPESGEMWAVHRVRETGDLRLPLKHLIHYADHSGNGGLMQEQLLTTADISYPSSPDHFGALLATEWGTMVLERNNHSPSSIGNVAVVPLTITPDNASLSKRA